MAAARRRVLTRAPRRSHPSAMFPGGFSWRSRATSRTSHSPTCSSSRLWREDRDASRREFRGDRRGLFRDGQILYATSRGGIGPAGKRLVSAGIISVKQLPAGARLMKIQKKDKAGRRLDRSWLDEGYVESAVLEEYIRGQISERALRPHALGNGSLMFESDEGFGDVDLGLSVTIDAVLADSVRRLELWNRIKRQDPNDGTRASRCRPTPARSPPTSISSPGNGCCCATCTAVAACASWSSWTGYNDFETAKVLYGMYARGADREGRPCGRVPGGLTCSSLSTRFARTSPPRSSPDSGTGSTTTPASTSRSRRPTRCAFRS